MNQLIKSVEDTGTAPHGPLGNAGKHLCPVASAVEGRRYRGVPVTSAFSVQRIQRPGVSTSE